jgi:hypothetical protein
MYSGGGGVNFVKHFKWSERKKFGNLSSTGMNEKTDHYKEQMFLLRNKLFLSNAITNTEYLYIA